MDDDVEEIIVTADLFDVRKEAFKYFRGQFEQNSDITAAYSRIYWELWEGIGYRDDSEHTFGGDCKLISDWLDDLTFAYNETEALHPETGAVLWANSEYIYANDFKVQLVGREVARYV